MSGQISLRIKKNGIFYTPNAIATLLISRAVDGSKTSILDPACGEGSLLTAALKRNYLLYKRNAPRLVGCDKFKQKNLDEIIKFVHKDFFKYSANEKFDLVLTNPPYIHSSKIEVKTRQRYYKKYAEAFGFSTNLDLWVYFLLKCTTHLKKGGTIAAVLPWSFLEAEYAQKVRKWLFNRFREIEVLVLHGAHFKGTVKRVLLVWLHGYGNQAKSIKIGDIETCNSELDFQQLPIKIWKSKNALVGLNPEIDNFLSKLQASGFRPLEKYANVSIGVVTGANKYFILPKEIAESKGFSGKSVQHILTSVDDLKSVASSKEMDKVLIQFERMTKRRKNYVRCGEKLGIDKRIHCARRKKQVGSWYFINPDPLPDAFFTYRVSTIPYLFRNPDSYQCTNSLHKVIFNGTSENEQKWIELSLLSLFGQLSLESNGRHYGNGILKIEPNALKRCLVYASKKPIERKLYDEIIQALCSDDKEKACLHATSIISNEVKIDNSLIDNIFTSINKIRTLRGATLMKRE